MKTNSLYLAIVLQCRECWTDDQDPVRDLPRAIFISCLACLVIYVLTIIAFHTTLSVPEVLGSEAVAVTFAGRLYGRMAWVSSGARAVWLILRSHFSRLFPYSSPAQPLGRSTVCCSPPLVCFSLERVKVRCQPASP